MSLDVEEDHPTKSKLIRQAINYGFDRKKMMIYFLKLKFNEFNNINNNYFLNFISLLKII